MIQQIPKLLHQPRANPAQLYPENDYGSQNQTHKTDRNQSEAAPARKLYFCQINRMQDKRAINDLGRMSQKQYISRRFRNLSQSFHNSDKSFIHDGCNPRNLSHVRPESALTSKKQSLNRSQIQNQSELKQADSLLGESVLQFFTNFKEVRTNNELKLLEKFENPKRSGGSVKHQKLGRYLTGFVSKNLQNTTEQNFTSHEGESKAAFRLENQIKTGYMDEDVRILSLLLGCQLSSQDRSGKERISRGQGGVCFLFHEMDYS